MTGKKLTVLFAPIDAFGHIHGCIGVGEALASFGHRVVFAITRPFAGTVTKYGLEEVFYNTKPETEEKKNVDPQEVDKETMIEFAKIYKEKDPVRKFELMIAADDMKAMEEGMKYAQVDYKSIINELKPDVIVMDNLYTQPALANSGIPYIVLWSGNPLMIYNNEKVPFWGLGLPANDKTDWERCRKQATAISKKACAPWIEYMKEQGCKLLPPDDRFPLADSPYANIYMYPKELDYEDLAPRPDKWYQFDTLVRSTKDTFEIPEKLRKLPGKLIYFSLGSVGTIFTELVQKWLDILAKLPHRFIVSGGPSIEKLVLAPNQWAGKFVPQTAVLQVVDLVITHGGNNTVTETMFYGKPMIALPIFGDQPENSQRIQEKGFGRRLDVYYVDEEELTNAVETLLGDKELQKRMKSVSHRIQNSNSQLNAAKLIEKVALDNFN